MKNASISIAICILVLFLLLGNAKNTPLNTPLNAIKPPLICVFNTKNGTFSRMNTEDYVLRCLAKEMPASFHPEALKAQAVAIRTYAYKKTTVRCAEHPNADICTDYRHCAAFLENESDLAPEHMQKLQKAVSDTSGEIILYDNEPITAVFHAISAGKTQPSESVWSTALPYLVAVDSATDQAAVGFETVAQFSKEQLGTALGIEEITPGEAIRNESGYVQSIVIGKKSFSGSEIRTRLQLRSSAFRVQETKDGLQFTVHGYGHGVGLSQVGANSCAENGMHYREIIEKYYPGTTLSHIC